MILHFTPIASKKGKGFYYQVKEKLESLNEALARYRADDDGWIEIDSDERIHWKADQYEVYDIYKRLTTEGKITPEDITALGYKSVDELASALAEGKTSLTKLKPLKPWFALNPPRHGFKRSCKRLYGQKGVLGHNKELLVIVKRMM